LNNHQRQSVRIIGGKWKGRKIIFSEQFGVRPTGNRIRETLFDWLRSDLTNAKCVDLFSGSGALGIEALSRGARIVKFIERDKETALFITKSLSAFEKDSSRSEVFCADANEWIQKSEETFDIVFIDPPFNGDSIYKICHEVEETGLAKRLIYLEWHSEIDSSLLPKKWDLLKHKKSGSVFFALCLKD
jgi:16S rRNA (guanine966-N2)-methyltransferase